MFRTGYRVKWRRGWKPLAAGVLGGGGLQLPFTDTFDGDGAIGSPWLNSATWTRTSGAAVNTPTVGAELLADGGLEDWASGTDLTSWTETKAGTTALDQETVEIHGGANALKLTVDGSSSAASISQSPALTLGDWLAFSFWCKSPNASTAYSKANNQTNQQPSFGLTTSYAQYFHNFLYRNASGWSVAVGSLAGNASDTQYYDDLSLKKLTFSTLFDVVLATTAEVTVKAACTIVNGTLAGVIMNLDSVTNPQNMVALLSNGASGNLHLLKCVAGTWTQVIVSSITYSAGANVECRKTGATTYQLWYNGAQIGTDQTISDASVITGKYHGRFSAHSGNSITSFTLA